MSLPQPPNVHALAVLLLTVLALFLFTRKNIPLESSSLLILISLIVGFELFPFPVDGGVLRAVGFFHGFGHEALVAVCALMIAGQGIVRTGALEPVGRTLARLWKVNPLLSLFLTLLVSAFISGFIIDKNRLAQYRLSRETAKSKSNKNITDQRATGQQFVFIGKIAFRLKSTFQICYPYRKTTP